MNYSRGWALHAAVLLTCAMGILAASAHASCVRSTERENLDRAGAVFVGRVVSVDQGGGAAVFRVQSVRKGSLKRDARVRVYARPYPSSVTISWAPKPGQRWRVYVQRHGSRWVTNDCMGTRRVT